MSDKPQPTTTTDSGNPVSSDEHSLTVGPNGPTVLHDAHLVQKMQHFNRERVPERVVHAKGSGAHGFFEVTEDVTQWTNASFLSEVGKRTPMFARFSQVAGELGSADTVRDPRGDSLSRAPGSASVSHRPSDVLPPGAECAFTNRDGWLVCTNGTSPPMGSPPFAVEGYRTIAYEICEQLGGRAPDWVVIPVSYGDCLAGVQRRFAHLAETGQIERAPRLAAAEPRGASSATAPSLPTRPSYAWSPPPG